MFYKEEEEEEEEELCLLVTCLIYFIGVKYVILGGYK